MHHVPQPLAVDLMQAASQVLVGEHDFAAFGQPTQGENTVRVIYAAQWHQADAVLTFDVVGNAFLRGMVRRLVGALLYVGSGHWPLDMMQRLLESRDRSLAAPPAPPGGLCLLQVDYAEGDEREDV